MPAAAVLPGLGRGILRGSGIEEDVLKCLAIWWEGALGQTGSIGLSQNRFFKCRSVR